MSTSPVTIATDGACKRNPGPAGWAWVSDDGRWESGSLRTGTNNIGELLALLNGLTHHADVPELTILIDSQYVIDSYTKWMDGWARKSWVTAGGAPVANPDIMRQLIVTRDSRRARGLQDVTLVKVKGHSGHILNAWADIKAVEASERAAAGIESIRGTGHGDQAADTTVLPAGATVRPSRPRGGRRRR